MVSARARALPENSVTPNGLGLSLTDITDAGYDRSPVTDPPEIFGREKSRAWAKAWDAALAMAPTWVLASVAAWRSPSASVYPRPTAAKISTRPQPWTLFGAPTSPH